MSYHHVVVVGCAGGHTGSGIYLTERGSRRDAIRTAEASFRRSNGLASSVALVARVVFSGTAEDGTDFIDQLMVVADARRSADG